MQQIIKSVAADAGITKRVVPTHLLRHTVAQHLLEGGTPLDQVPQKLLHLIKRHAALSNLAERDTMPQKCGYTRLVMPASAATLLMICCTLREL